MTNLTGDEVEHYAESDVLLTQIDQLVANGVLSSENCPGRHFRHWAVLRPDELPQELRANHEDHGEIWIPRY